MIWLYVSDTPTALHLHLLQLKYNSRPHFLSVECSFHERPCPWVWCLQISSALNEDRSRAIFCNFFHSSELKMKQKLERYNPEKRSRDLAGNLEPLQWSWCSWSQVGCKMVNISRNYMGIRCFVLKSKMECLWKGTSWSEHLNILNMESAHYSRMNYLL
jgi:hypothetical protein